MEGRRAWQYVMWEGGIIDVLTPVNFLLGAAVFVLASRDARHGVATRRWLVAYALSDIALFEQRGWFFRR